MNHHRSTTAAVVLVLAALSIAACGSSSKSPTTATTATAASTAASTTGRFSAFRECLAKNGVKLPPRKPGSGPGGILGGELPSGVNRGAYEAAARKCAGFRPSGGLRGKGFASSRFRALLTTFAACMRSHGIKLPPPNTSGKGAIFDTKGVDTKAPAFLTAAHACQSALRPAGAKGASG